MMKKIVLWILVISWSVMIFCFSSQNADMSDKTSIGLTANIIKMADRIFDIRGLETDEDVEEIASFINGYIRKVAHFSIYCVLGILTISLANCYFNSKKSLLYALFYCLIYAISDEIHQLFVPGRAWMIMDVVIDFSGSILGNIIFYFLKRKKQ